MARPRKVPAVLVEATVRENGKLAALPSDTARLGYFYICLGAAKLLDPPGLFSSRQHFKEVAGRFARHLPAYELNGLVEVAPKLCGRCRERWANMPPKKGQLVVHDWHEHQYDPARLERQRAYDERQRQASEAEESTQSDAISDGVSGPISDHVSHAQSDHVSHAQSDHVSHAQSDGVSDGFLTGDSRGRARDRAVNVNVERRTENEEVPLSESVDAPANGRAPVQVRGFRRVGDVATEMAEQTDDWRLALTLAERDEWSSFGPEWGAFRAAWLKRGFRHPPAGTAEDDPDAPNPSQRALLWSVLDAWPSEMPQWIAEAPKKLSASGVVAHVIERWHGKRDEANERAVIDEGNDSDRDRWRGPQPNPASRPDESDALPAFLQPEAMP